MCTILQFAIASCEWPSADYIIQQNDIMPDTAYDVFCLDWRLQLHFVRFVWALTYLFKWKIS